MIDRTFLEWPFFNTEHRELAARLEDWCGAELDPGLAHGESDEQARALVALLGKAGFLHYCVPAEGAGSKLDVRSLCIIRETLARYGGLADFAFAMQGLGAGPLSLFGTAAQQRYLRAVGAGEMVAAFAISEAEAGSDVSSIGTKARRDGDKFILDGTKTWISNAGIADFYIVFARTGEAPGAKGLSAFVVEAANPGLRVSERIEVTSPHPLGSLELKNCRVAADALIGKAGDGFKIAMATLDVFRSTVGAAALGFARRAMFEAVQHARQRTVFGQSLASFQMTQDKVALMATDIDAAALLVYRAAWAKDAGAARVTREAAMAKLFATESAQLVIDRAVQMLGGRGVIADSVMERLYRDIRPLRIYEGTSEIQKLIIAAQILEER